MKQSNPNRLDYFGLRPRNDNTFLHRHCEPNKERRGNPKIIKSLFCGLLRIFANARNDKFQIVIASEWNE